MRWGAYFGFLAFAVIIAEVYLLLVKPAGEIDAIFKKEYATLSMDQQFEETISGEVRRWAEEFKGFHLPNSKNGMVLSSLIAFRWVMIQNLLPMFLISAGVGISEGILRRARMKELLGFFSPRKFHLATEGLGLIFLPLLGYSMIPLVLPVSHICIFSVSVIMGCFYCITSNYP